MTVIDKAAWTKNTTLGTSGMSGTSNAGKVFETNDNNVEGTGVEAMDLAAWIMGTFQKSDFVFLKIDIEAAEFQVIPHLFETGAIEYIDEFQIEWHDWGNFRTKETLAQRVELEQRLENYGLGNKFATFDKEMDGVNNVNFAKVPKYYDANEYPTPWVDIHYFRKAEGCHSPWDVLHNYK